MNGDLCQATACSGVRLAMLGVQISSLVMKTGGTTLALVSRAPRSGQVGFSMFPGGGEKT